MLVILVAFGYVAYCIASSESRTPRRDHNCVMRRVHSFRDVKKNMESFSTVVLSCVCAIMKVHTEVIASVNVLLQAILLRTRVIQVRLHVIQTGVCALHVRTLSSEHLSSPRHRNYLFWNISLPAWPP